MKVLVLDVGTSSTRATVLDGDGHVVDSAAAPLASTVSTDGTATFDPVALADTTVAIATELIGRTGPPDAVGIANQRASTVVWDRRDGTPVGPGLGWQDMRTVGRCLALQAEGVRVAPNASATKIEWLAQQTEVPRHHLGAGTIDTWLTWRLSDGATHVTDATNAGVTGLSDGAGWSDELCVALGIERDWLPAIVDTAGDGGVASVLPGTPRISGRIGDQQASLAGQGCTGPGDAKITFGTGGMLDLVVDEPVDAVTLARTGCYPIVVSEIDGRTTPGVEAIMLGAGSHVAWLVDVGAIGAPSDTDDLAGSVDDTDGVLFVPAMHGLGTPFWDHGARATFLGLTRGTTRAHIARAVLEGIAHRGADLVEAAEAASGLSVAEVRIDGGMSANVTFARALADACGRPVITAAEVEATTRGAAMVAGVGAGLWSDLADAAGIVPAGTRVEPRSESDRDRWRDAVERARAWIPELSGISF